VFHFSVGISFVYSNQPGHFGVRRRRKSGDSLPVWTRRLPPAADAVQRGRAGPAPTDGRFGSVASKPGEPAVPMFVFRGSATTT